jgi:hypothetical protein
MTDVDRVSFLTSCTALYMYSCRGLLLAGRYHVDEDQQDPNENLEDITIDRCSGIQPEGFRTPSSVRLERLLFCIAIHTKYILPASQPCQPPQSATSSWLISA